MAFANRNIVVKNFQNLFQQSGPIRVIYYLDIGNFFLQFFLQSAPAACVAGLFELNTYNMLVIQVYWYTQMAE